MMIEEIVVYMIDKAINTTLLYFTMFVRTWTERFVGLIFATIHPEGNIITYLVHTFCTVKI